MYFEVFRKGSCAEFCQMFGSNCQILLELLLYFFQKLLKLYLFTSLVVLYLFFHKCVVACKHVQTDIVNNNDFQANTKRLSASASDIWYNFSNDFDVYAMYHY